MAVDRLRRRRWIAHLDPAQESRAPSLLAVVGGVGEVPHSVLAAGQPRQPSGMVSLVAGNKRRTLCRRGTDQPALHADRDRDANNFSRISNGLTKPVPPAPDVAGCRLAVRIRLRLPYMVRTLAKDLRRLTRGLAFAGRTRSRGSATA